MDERALWVTESFDLSYIESNDARGEPAPIWQLTDKPLSANVDLHKAVLDAIWAPKYWLNIHLLEIGKRLIECAWCKADTHPVHACLFPQTLPPHQSLAATLWQQAPRVVVGEAQLAEVAEAEEAVAGAQTLSSLHLMAGIMSPTAHKYILYPNSPPHKWGKI